jgi:hypothetical protein
MEIEKSPRRDTRDEPCAAAVAVTGLVMLWAVALHELPQS